MVFLSIYQQYNEKQAFIDPILSLINTSICGPGLHKLDFFIVKRIKTVKTKKFQVVLSYLAKNAKLNVYSLLTKDLLLCSWTVPS